MKITNLMGSPRQNGNSATIAQTLLEQLAAADPETKTHVLNQLTYRGCQGCMACKTTSDICVVQDDLSGVLEDIRTSGVVFFSSPVYFGELTGQAKGALDRFYSFMGKDYRTNPKPSRLAAGKILVFILPQGNPDGTNFAELIERYTRMFKRLGFNQVFSIRALGAGQGSDVRKSEDIRRAVHEVAEKILNTGK